MWEKIRPTRKDKEKLEENKGKKPPKKGVIKKNNQRQKQERKECIAQSVRAFDF